MFGVIFNHLKEKKYSIFKFKELRVPTKTARWYKAHLLTFMVTCVSLLLLLPSNGYFYIFCRTFGPTLWHFLSDIQKKCPIVRRISTALACTLMRVTYRLNNSSITISPQQHGAWEKENFKKAFRILDLRAITWVKLGHLVVKAKEQVTITV